MQGCKTPCIVEFYGSYLKGNDLWVRKQLVFEQYVFLKKKQNNSQKMKFLSLSHRLLWNFVMLVR